jgi:hypothetical protein
VLRRCEHRHCTRNAASETFWCLGASGVGKATLAGWRDTLRPALRDPNHRFSVWPFDGQLEDLLASSDAVLVETYPADAYLQLGLSIGRKGSSASSLGRANTLSPAACTRASVDAVHLGGDCELGGEQLRASTLIARCNSLNDWPM